MGLPVLHLLIGAGAGSLTATALLCLCFLVLRRRRTCGKDCKPGGKKRSRVRLSLPGQSNGAISIENAEDSCDSEQTLIESTPKCHECRKLSTPEKPCKCDIDIWESVAQEKPCMIQFSLYYNYHNSHLFVHIICAVNVTQRWHGKYPSTRVRFQLLPNTENCYKTEVRSNTSEPNFNETFDFIGYSQSELLDLKLLLGLYTYDRFSRKKMLGFLELPFNTVTWDATHPVILWENLEPRPKGRVRSISGFSKGEIQFSLRYDAKASRLNVVVLKATNLPRPGHFRGTGYYVTAAVTDGEGQEIQSRHTKKKKGRNPVWNKGFLFDVTDRERFEAHALIIVKVMSHDLMFNDETVGQVTVGPKEEESGRKHWQEVMKKKHIHREVAITHALQ